MAGPSSAPLAIRNVSPDVEVDLTPEADAPGTGHRDRRHDEFRHAPGGRVEHEIEW